MIEFDDSLKSQTKKLIKNKNTMIYMVNILVFVGNNYFSFKNNIEYIWVKFMQANKMTKKSIEIFFKNLNLAMMQKHLNYKNVNKIKALLIELLYSKVIW